MKSLLIKLGVVWVMLTSLFPAVFSQGVLVIEISDTLNVPLSGYNVRIKDSEGTVKVYKTDSEGRVRDDNFPVGEYSYGFSYGDYNTGGFKITSGKPTWVDIDFRRVVVNFKDENGKPSSGNFVTLYKREAGGSRTLVAQKSSDSNGAALFVVPEGNYTYVAADGEHDIVVSDQNINTSVSVSSKTVTYKTSFRFVKDGVPVKIYAKDVRVRRTQNGIYKDFGIVLAHGDIQTDDFVEYTTTDGKISCPIGEYEYSVYTRDYGALEGVFYVTQGDSESNNVVDIALTEKTTPGDSIIEPDKEEKTVRLTFHIVNCGTSDPIPGVAVWYTVPGVGNSRFSSTDQLGYCSFDVNPGTYDLSIPTEIRKDMVVDGDTTIEFCASVDPDNPTSDQESQSDLFQWVSFQFFHKGEEVFPQTIGRIDTRKIVGNSYLSYVSLSPTEDRLTGIKKFRNPLLTIPGRYYYSFQLDEYYATSYSGFFTTSSSKHLDTVKIVFEERYKVDVHVLHRDSTPVFNSYGVACSGVVERLERTDEFGHLSMILPAGEYAVSALDQSLSLDLKSDTTLYFLLPEEREVYFKFLHDGKVVYPNVSTLSFDKKRTGSRYAYLSSTLHENYEDLGRTYVFDKPVELPADTFVAGYYISDYEFDGFMSHDFSINSVSEKDTTIYLVVPVKRTVEIQIKDANGANVQGVFAQIYKYGEDGLLSRNLEYDGNSHSKLMSDAAGIVRDRLVPGRYQIRILDIVRDFEVTEYDLRFTVLSDVELFDVKFTVLYSDDHSPVPNQKFDFKKGNEFYNNCVTDENGVAKFQSEDGSYSYILYYGDGINGSYKITKSEEFVIYVDRPVLVEAIALIGGEACLNYGESTKFLAIVSPDSATQKNIEWSIDNNVVAKVSGDGTLTANTLGIDGTVNLTAKTKDGSGVFASVSVNISGEECVKSYVLAFDDGSTEMWLDDYVFGLVVTPSQLKHEYYGYQTSRDCIHWTTVAGPTQDSEVTVPADNYMYKGTRYFRAVAADDAGELQKILDGLAEPAWENTTNVVVLHSAEGERPISDKIMIPTVFTPHEVNGANDDFMPGYPVVIYNRFGDVICNSDNGWDGTYKNEIADAGVYIYVLTLKDGKEVRGTIQLYRK